MYAKPPHYRGTTIYPYTSRYYAHLGSVSQTVGSTCWRPILVLFVLFLTKVACIDKIRHGPFFIFSLSGQSVGSDKLIKSCVGLFADKGQDKNIGEITAQWLHSIKLYA